MKIPVVRGLIDRRILVNFRIDPGVLSRVLPSPFRPKLMHGLGMAGICLIRLKHIRPRHLPSFLGISSENAAHRIAVEWEQSGDSHQGVFIPRRDTSSWLNSLAGGRLFPGVHHHARFRIREQEGNFQVGVDSDDRQMHVAIAGHLTSELPPTSVFGSVQEASEFFECGSVGYSTTAAGCEFDGLELRTFSWDVQPLQVEHVKSSYFEDLTVFPPGSVEFDSALLMRQIEHEWHSKPTIRT